jgi:hypothetical protein
MTAFLIVIAFNVLWFFAFDGGDVDKFKKRYDFNYVPLIAVLHWAYLAFGIFCLFN